jgi:F-type H+-transporting ATPase subunit delta
VNPAVEGYAAAVFESVGGDAEALATELSAIERLVASNAQLASALTDTSVPGPARRAIMSELLEHRVGPAARRLAAYAASAVRAPDVPGALDWAAHRARAHARSLPMELALLGHQAARGRVGGYAAALFEQTETAQLEEIEDQLFRFARIVESHPELRSALTDRERPVAQRQAVVDQLLSGKVEPTTLRLIRFVIAGGRPRDFVGALDWLVEQTAAARGWRVARVRSAEAIDDRQHRALSEALSHLTGTPVELQVTIDPGLLGGAVIQVGDLQIDASARGRLDRLREDLLPVGARSGADGQDRARGDQ